MTDKPTYNAQEAAQFLGIKKIEFVRLCRKRLIKHIHMNNRSHRDVRISSEELQRFRDGSI